MPPHFDGGLRTRHECADEFVEEITQEALWRETRPRIMIKRFRSRVRKISAHVPNLDIDL